MRSSHSLRTEAWRTNLQTVFGSATWQAVREHLSYVNCERSLRVPDWLDRPRVVQDGFLSLDTDKIVYCLAVTDSLSGYDRQNPLDGGKHQG